MGGSCFLFVGRLLCRMNYTSLDCLAEFDEVGAGLTRLHGLACLSWLSLLSLFVCLFVCSLDILLRSQLNQNLSKQRLRNVSNCDKRLTLTRDVMNE